MSRSVYAHRDLSRVLAPQSVAIVGATPRPESFADRSIRNMARFDGRLYLVTDRYREINGVPCYSSLKDLPEPPDSVLIASGRETVETFVAQCAEVGAGGVTIFASGYKETGKPEREELELRLGDIARRTGLRIIGPNCLGVINYSIGMALSFTSDITLAKPSARAIGLVSQSGTVGIGLAQAIEHGTSFSHLLTSGNSCDVDAADLVSYLAEDESCAAIACLFEGLAEPGRLIEAARKAKAANKVLVIYKLASSESGARAALSHTGSMAGSHTAFVTAMEREGAVLVDRLESFIETASFFAKVRERPVAPGVAVVSASGGLAIMAADIAERRAVELPQPSSETTRVLEQFIPEFGSARNPCDATAQVATNPASLSQCAEALLRDPAFGALVLTNAYSKEYMRARAAGLSALASSFPDKPVCMSWNTEWLEGPGSSEIKQSRVPFFRSLDRCLETIAKWHARCANIELQMQGEARYATSDAAEAARQIILRIPDRQIGESMTKAILEYYGIPQVPEARASTLDEALSEAAKIGYPVAIKIISPDIAHKTEAGGVELAIADPSALADAYARMMESVARLRPEARIDGISVQKMIGIGREILLGARVDRSYGPLIMVGLGGIIAELLEDTRTALGPLSKAAARKMLGELRGAHLLTGFRGSKPVNIDKLTEIIVRFSQFVCDHQDLIDEIDLNPLICVDQDIWAADGLIVKRTPRQQ